MEPGMVAQESRRTFEVLLATWNGERFLAALLDSLLAQDFGDFTILARDDCSDDKTAAILDDYACRFPGRLRILATPRQRGGACSNFGALIEAATADFIFLCDQDDIWLPNKMSVTYAAMAALMSGRSADCPLLVHTDLAVVGRNLEPLGESYFRYAGVDPRHNGLRQLLLANVATGCTALLNRALYELARPIPEVVLMHDHWLAQVAAGLGEISVVPQATILYRQHAANAVGTEKASVSRFLRRVERTFFSDSSLSVLQAYSRHAEVLLERYGDRLDAAARKQLAALAEVWTLPRFRRFAGLWRAGVRKSGLAQNVAMLLLLLRNDIAPRAARA
jgi:glycosyltransferase involved in cell wall biosynthesis